MKPDTGPAVNIIFMGLITQPIAALINQTQSKFRDDTAIDISQFIQSKINQSKLFLLYNPTVYPK